MKTDKFILKSEGKFINVTFVKNDGTIRKLNGRLGVKKHLKGGVSTLNPVEYITIYDVVNKGYRAINRNNIIEVTCEGHTVTNNALIGA